ncbi:MAG: DNA-3-methyladenine glycosylase [Thermostichus sp. DG_1_6_bins_120]
MYHYLNIVTAAEGIPATVLIRSVSLEVIPKWIPPQKRHRPERVGAGATLSSLAH